MRLKAYFCEMEKQMVEIWGFHILEPGTVISDIIMGIASLYFFYVLFKISESRLQKHTSFFFFFLGLSSLIGAFAHGFYFYTGKSLHYVTWILTGIATYFFEYGISENFKIEKNKRVFIRLIEIQLAVYMVITTIFMNFLTVKINTAVGLLGVGFPILVHRLFKEKKINNLYIMSGIILAIIPAIFHKANFPIISIFNANDLSHFFLILCLFLIYTGFYKNSTEEKRELNQIMS